MADVSNLEINERSNIERLYLRVVTIKLSIWKIPKIANLGNSKNCQFKKFEKITFKKI